MNWQQKHALVEFVIESANGIAKGDWEGVNELWQEMAAEAEKAGVILPMTVTIRMAAEHGRPVDSMSNAEMAAWLKGWAYAFENDSDA